MNPNGLRVGTPAMTSRGLMEEDFVKIGQYLGRPTGAGSAGHHSWLVVTVPYGYLIKKTWGAHHKIS